MSDQSETLATVLAQLKPLANRMATVKVEGANKFSTCLVSSFVKAFEFAELACEHESASAIFLTSSLRSVTEEIIVLNFLSKYPHEDREFVIERLMLLDVANDIKEQKKLLSNISPVPASLGAYAQKRGKTQEGAKGLLARTRVAKI